MFHHVVYQLQLWAIVCVTQVAYFNITDLLKFVSRNVAEACHIIMFLAPDFNVFHNVHRICTMLTSNSRWSVKFVLILSWLLETLYNVWINVLRTRLFTKTHATTKIVHKSTLLYISKT